MTQSVKYLQKSTGTWAQIPSSDLKAHICKPSAVGRAEMGDYVELAGMLLLTLLWSSKPSENL